MLTLEDLGINYQVLSLEDQLLEILKGIHSAKSHPSQASWNDYWGTFQTSQHPTYLKRDEIFRYKGNYIKTDVDVEERYFYALKEIYFKRYFGDCSTIAEYGCGTGSNLLQIQKMFPNKTLSAHDWSQAAVNLAAHIADTATLFDMLEPHFNDGYDYLNAGVLTCGSMEQLGAHFHYFLDFLISLKAKIYLHIEPIIELYDPNSVFDYLAIMYHQKRGYLEGFLPALQNSKVKILEQTRTGFGCKAVEGYMVIAWTLN